MDKKKLEDNFTPEDMSIFEEDDRLYLKSLKTKLTKDEERIKCGGNRKSNNPQIPTYR